VNQVVRLLFFALLVKPFVLIVLGINIKRPEWLPRRGPAILVANHNSHLDTVVLISLFPLRMLPAVRPVAAADYFLRNPLLAWFALRVIGIIPLPRTGRTPAHEHPLTPCVQALERGDILVLFPEGTRGEPEQRARFKSGVAHLAKCRPDVPVVPVFMRGLGRALPRGEALFVPWICDIGVGEPVVWQADKETYMGTLQERFDGLANEMAALHHDLYDEEDYHDTSM
jgi:1-acyl-sn-glycerol-3-phosphate acyltransferase